MLPAAIIHVILTVIVAENHLVDRLSAIVDIADQRMAECILERAIRTIGNRHTDTAQFAGMDIISAKEEIILTVLFDGGWRPQRIGRPAHIPDIEHMFMFLPVNQVIRGEGIHVGLLEEGRPNVRIGAQFFLRLAQFSRCGRRRPFSRKCRIYPVPMIENADLRIGIPAGYDRITGVGRESRQPEYRRQTRSAHPVFPVLTTIGRRPAIDNRTISHCLIVIESLPPLPNLT